MIYNENSEPNIEGHNPKVSNANIEAEKSNSFLIIFLFIITLGLFYIYYLTTRNNLNRQQVKINECASGIDVQLAKRKDTLVKLIDATKSMCNYEASLLKDITNLRKMTVNNENRGDIDQIINSAFSRLIAVSENYPEIKASEAFKSLMNAADYIEREIAAARRTYNSAVSSFNAHIVSWPSSYIAAKYKMHTIKMFEASQSQKEDVNLSF